MADYNTTMKIIRKKAPKLELSPLEQSIDKHNFTDSDEYVVDRVFSNALGNIPKEFHDIQKAYFELVLYYYKNKDYCLEDPKATASLALSRLSVICYVLFNPSMLRETLGESPIYKKTAEDIIDFYSERREDIELLLNLGANLVNKYLAIVFKRNHKQKVPSIVKEIWEDVKKQAVKNV